MKFPKEHLQELVWGDGPEEYEVVKNQMVDKSRWSTHYELVFKFNDKFYSTPYSAGSTEMQDERAFEYDGDEIECAEVVPVERTIVEYIVKKQPTE